MRSIILFVASIFIGMASYAQSLRYAPGGDIEVCANPLQTNTCKSFVDKSTLYDVKYIVSPSYQPGSLLTWIEVRDSYSICAAKKQNFKEYSCERISLPVLQGTNLQVRADRAGNIVLALSLEKELSDLPQTVRRTITRQYSYAMIEAAKLVYSRLNRRPELPDTVVDSMPWKGVIIAQSCDDYTDPLRVNGSKTTGEIQPQACIYDDLDIWYLNSFSSFGISFGIAQNPACVAACTATYDRDVAYCKIFPEPRARAICYAAATAKYGACLARC